MTTSLAVQYYSTVVLLITVRYSTLLYRLQYDRSLRSVHEPRPFAAMYCTLSTHMYSSTVSTCIFFAFCQSSSNTMAKPQLAAYITHFITASPCVAACRTMFLPRILPGQCVSNVIGLGSFMRGRTPVGPCHRVCRAVVSLRLYSERSEHSPHLLPITSIFGCRPRPPSAG